MSKAIDKLKPGTRFLRYRLSSCVGRGAFGSVWSANEEGSDENIAIKFEFPHVSVSILETESEILRDIQGSDYFPIYFNHGTSQGLHYLCLELLGMSVRQFQENHTQGIVPLGSVGRLGIQMVRCLEAFHEACYVHRDIKPLQLCIQKITIRLQHLLHRLRSDKTVEDSRRRTNSRKTECRV